MATLTTLQNNIISDLGRNDSGLAATVLIDIQSAIRDYEAYRFYFNEQVLSVTVSAVSTYALSLFTPSAGAANPNDLVEIDTVKLIVSASRTYELEEKTWKEIDTYDTGGAPLAGFPQEYAYFNQSIRLYPVPNATYTLTIAAHVRFNQLTTGSDSNPWTNDAAELIRCSALKRLWGRRYRDYQAAQAMQIGETQALQALQRRTDALSGSRILGSM